MRFLSGYGFYITVSSDRLVGRVLDSLASSSAPPHDLLDSFDELSFVAAQRFCRVGVLANTIRAALASFRLAGLPVDAWADPANWVGRVPAAVPFPKSLWLVRWGCASRLMLLNGARNAQ